MELTDLTFGEQIKKILEEKDMHVGRLAALLRQQTGKEISARELAIKLNDDLCTEVEMHQIAQALGCVLYVSVIDPMEEAVKSIQSMLPESVKTEEEDEEIVYNMSSESFADTAYPANEYVKKDYRAEKYDVEEAVEAGAEDFVPEKFNPEQFLTKNSEMYDADPEADDAAEAGNAEAGNAEAGNAGAGNAETEPSFSSGGTVSDPDDAFFSEIEAQLKASLEKDFFAEGAGDTWGHDRVNAGWMESAEKKWDEEMALREEEESENGEDDDEILRDPDEPFGYEEDGQTHEMRDLDMDGFSGVSGPYVLKREEEPEEVLQDPDISEEPGKAGETGNDGKTEKTAVRYDIFDDGGAEVEDETLEPGAHPLHMNIDGAIVSDPYVIERTEEPEEDDEPIEEEYVKLTEEELAKFREESDFSDVPEHSEGPVININHKKSIISSIKEEDVGETIASWDAAAQKQVGRTISEKAEEQQEEKKEESSGIPEETRRIAMINPATGEEFESNSVLHHPTKIGVLLVYDRDNHSWSEQNEWAFQNFQIKKKQEMGADYIPPLYLD